MKKKKGFTLVELLAVIAILAILATVATPLVMTASKNIKKKMFAAKVKMIETAAVNCAQQYKDDDCNTVRKLCDKKFLSKSDKADVCQENPTNNKEMADCSIDIAQPYGRYVAIFPKNGETNSDCKPE